MKRIILIFTFVSLFCMPVFGARPRQCDVCVYGESASGVMAAIQAARMGKSTVLVSKNSHVGGLATSGLTATDINRHTIIGGLAEEFYRRIYDYYLADSVWRNQTRDEFMVSTRKRTFSGKSDARRMQWVYESGVGERIMKQMLAEAGVEVIYGARLDLKKGVVKSGSDIRRIVFEDGSSVAAGMFIDASYEGDLMALAGVSYIVGRESKWQYNETLAGIRLDGEVEMSPYADREGGRLLPYIDAGLWGEEGDADGRTQTYCYRLTLTDDPTNMVPIERPENYDPELYEVVLARKIIGKPDVQLKNIITFTPMPNRKTDTNHLDFVGASYGYPEGDYAERERIERAHKEYALGMLWFLGNDPRVPEHLRTEMKRWGLAADEFADSGHFPYQIYVREARRMVGQEVMTEHNVRRDFRVEARYPVGVGSYMLDCHYVSHVAGDDGKVHIEGNIFTSTRPYPISYYSLVPKAGECGNLLVPVCLSASHVAYASIRMEPTYMVLGQSAAAAAVLALDSGCTVQQIDYGKLKTILTEAGQILTPAESRTK